LTTWETEMEGRRVTLGVDPCPLCAEQGVMCPMGDKAMLSMLTEGAPLPFLPAASSRPRAMAGSRKPGTYGLEPDEAADASVGVYGLGRAGKVEEVPQGTAKILIPLFMAYSNNYATATLIRQAMGEEGEVGDGAQHFLPRGEAIMEAARARELELDTEDADAPQRTMRGLPTGQPEWLGRAGTGPSRGRPVPRARSGDEQGSVGGLNAQRPRGCRAGCGGTSPPRGSQGHSGTSQRRAPHGSCSTARGITTIR